MRATFGDVDEEGAAATLCHKLRTPLTAALGFLQLALRDAQRSGAETQSQHLQMVDSQLRRMCDLIDELADRIPAKN